MSSRRHRIPVALGLVAYLVLGSTNLSSLYGDTADASQNCDSDSRGRRKCRLAADFVARRGRPAAERPRAEAFDGWDALKAQALRRATTPALSKSREGRPLGITSSASPASADPPCHGPDSLANHCRRVASIAGHHVGALERRSRGCGGRG
jgi:hypothetical protein